MGGKKIKLILHENDDVDKYKIGQQYKQWALATAARNMLETAAATNIVSGNSNFSQMKWFSELFCVLLLQMLLGCAENEVLAKPAKRLSEMEIKYPGEHE